MNMKYALLTGCLAITALGACVSEDRDLGQDSKTDKGRLALNVTRTEPMETRAVTEVSNYPVLLYDKNGDEVMRWDALSEVPATYVLSVGNYTVESHTPGVIQKRMTTPYYKGTTEVEILKDTKTKAEVVCKMQNSPITVHYDQNFLDVFTAWEITLNDGGTTALSFTDANGTAPATIYWLFEDEAEELKLDFRGTTTEGSTVVDHNVLTKNIAVEHYDGDSQFFTGGDALNINFTPVETTAGHVTAIIINADVTFTETNSKLTLEVTDNGKTQEPSEEDPIEEDPLNLCPDNNHPHAIDMGTGVKWACCNVGAESESQPQAQYGSYFAWGETTTKTTYSWSTYKWSRGNGSKTLTKYNNSSSYGNVDYKIQLELSDDAARVNWGGNWRMPTIDELNALNTQCTWTWTTVGDKNGYKVTATNGNTLFLPAAGYRGDSGLRTDGSNGHYWSSSLYTPTANNAHCLNLNSSSHNVSCTYRQPGYSVRPVTE